MPITIATLAPIFVNITGGLFLIVCSNKQYANRKFLSLFMFNSSLLFIGHFLYFQQYISLYHYYDFIFLFALLAFFPLYYIYVKSVFDFQVKLRKFMLHFLPAALISILTLILTFAANDSVFVEYFHKMTGNIPSTNYLSKSLFSVYQLARFIHVIQILIYSTAIIRYILSNLHQLKNYFSNMGKIQPRYFAFINGLFLLFMVISGLATTLSGRASFSGNTTVLCFSGIVFSVMHLIVCLHGINQVPVYAEIAEEKLIFSDTFTSFSTGEEIERRLLSYFESDRPWLNPDLKIWDIVIALGTNRTYLSKVINEQLDSNFNDFVNSYRVKEALVRIKEEKLASLSLQTIAEMSGFGSVTSFSRAFKKNLGHTPTEYLAAIRSRLI